MERTKKRERRKQKQCRGELNKALLLLTAPSRKQDFISITDPFVGTATSPHHSVLQPIAASDAAQKTSSVPVGYGMTVNADRQKDRPLKGPSTCESANTSSTTEAVRTVCTTPRASSSMDRGGQRRRLSLPRENPSPDGMED